MSEELTLLPCPACKNTNVVLRAYTRAYGFCPACGMCGPCAPKVDMEYAVKQWNALSRALEWTDEPPKVPGWYWWRNLSKPQVVHSNNFKNRKPHPADEWAGPIPEPREPKE